MKRAEARRREQLTYQFAAIAASVGVTALAGFATYYRCSRVGEGGRGRQQAHRPASSCAGRLSGFGAQQLGALGVWLAGRGGGRLQRDVHSPTAAAWLPAAACRITCYLANDQAFPYLDLACTLALAAGAAFGMEM